MKSLNEKLAIGVMGWEVKHDHSPPYRSSYISKKTGRPKLWDVNEWQPTTDLNQLRECYLALSEDEKRELAYHLYKMFCDTGFLGTDSPSFGIEWLTRIMLTESHMFAQAILKAKGVE
jgi:hypothetical protein